MPYSSLSRYLKPSEIMKKKVLIILVGVAGLSGLFLGLMEDNNLLFIIGITIVIGAYLHIRKRLKASMRKME